MPTPPSLGGNREETPDAAHGSDKFKEDSQMLEFLLMILGVITGD